MLATETIQESDLKFRTSIPEQAATKQNEPLIPPSASYAIPRANVAATREAPNGTEKDQYGYRNRKKTVSFVSPDMDIR